jgi:hypothetical protein
MRKKYSTLVRAALLALIICAMSLVAFAQAKTASNSPAGTKDMHGLIIHGEGFVFLAREPNAWDTDTGDVARKYGANAVFFPRAQTSRSHHVTIRVRLNSKTTEDPKEDMASDVNQYKKEYPATQFGNLEVKHPQYPTSAKLFYMPHDFYEYVAYLNPGRQWNFTFSVAMSKEKEPATQDEIAAFSHVLRSLQFVTGKVEQVPRR